MNSNLKNFDKNTIGDWVYRSIVDCHLNKIDSQENAF